MADDAQEGGQEGQADGGLDDRVSQLETGQQTLTGKIDQILGILGGGGGDGHGAPEGSGAPGGSVAAEIRQQLDERDRKNADEASKSATSDRLGALETKISELAEKPPGPLPRRVEKLMGWS